jgi:hypothetical protein
MREDEPHPCRSTLPTPGDGWVGFEIGLRLKEGMRAEAPLSNVDSGRKEKSLEKVNT